MGFILFNIRRNTGTKFGRAGTDKNTEVFWHFIGHQRRAATQGLVG